MPQPDAGRWVQLRAAEGRFLPPPEVTGGGGRGAIPKGGRRISSTITAPVMKGLRGGEEKVQQVVIIVHCMLQRISKYSQKACVY